eukprot:TRINITY_DN3762_c1_g1_i1.p1 TRINITY_DN3762_c1_g1~~TRINITY_DN3762_c1_g1_i1.p1  ORF type:complete len:715 (+),score=210.08 TRINITY_DN3762_c1_g1_i1:47-2191(+)
MSAVLLAWLVSHVGVCTNEAGTYNFVTGVPYECSQVTEAAKLYWTMEGDGSQVHVALAVADVTGWIAVSFPKTRGQMTPASAIVGYSSFTRVVSLSKDPREVKSDPTFLTRSEYKEVRLETIAGVQHRVLRFSRLVSRLPSPTLSLNYAYHTTLDSFPSQHDNRGGWKEDIVLTLPSCTTWSIKTTDDYKLCSESHNGEVILHLTVKTTGWVAFGIARQPDGNLTGSDVATISWVNKFPVVTDTYIANDGAKADTCGDEWWMHNVNRAGGVVTGTLRRAVEAGNTNEDRPFTPGPMRIIIAYGDYGEDTVDYHNAALLATTKVFIEGDAPTPADTPFGLPNACSTSAPPTGSPTTPPPAGSCIVSQRATKGFENNGRVCVRVLDTKAALHYRHDKDKTWFELVVAQDGGWSAIGFPSEAGQMVGSRVVAVDGEYYELNGKTPLSIIQVSGLGTPFEVHGNLEVYVSTSNGEQVVSFSTPARSAYDLVVAYRAEGVFPNAKHDVSLAVRVESDVPATNGNGDKAKAHGAVMVTMWSYVVPCAIVVKGAGGRLGDVGGVPVAYVLHAFLMGTAMVVTTAFFGVALSEFDGDARHGHKGLGITLVTVGWAQVILGLAAPSKDHDMRFTFKVVHALTGAALVALALAQQVTGLVNMKDLHSATVQENLIAALVVGLVVFVAAGVGLAAAGFWNSEVATSSKSPKSNEPADEALKDVQL